MTTVLVFVATVLAGLNAGFYASFSFAVMPGLRRTPDETFTRTMRDINVAIINPVFLVVFLGPLLLGLASLVALLLGETPMEVLAPTAVGVVLHVVTIAVTAVVNVPLNNALEAAGDVDAADARRVFEPRWVAWNHLRSLTSAGALVAFAVALLAVAR